MRDEAPQVGERDLLPLSGLQHLVYCERQFALIHVEQIWTENVQTVEGRQLHEQVDGGEAEARGDVRIARSVPLRSLRLGLTGRSDVVELKRDAGGVEIPGIAGRWRPYPVEYKRGKPKPHRADEVQLCAQGMCLEEMLGVEVPLGALFYGLTRRRVEVPLDGPLRALVESTARRARELFDAKETPPGRREPKCERCSLLELCKPDAGARSAVQYLSAGVQAALVMDEEEVRP